MKKLIKNKISVILGICVFIIMLIWNITLQIQNRKLEIVNGNIESSYEEVNKRYDDLLSENKELLKQVTKNEVLNEELEKENKLLKESKDKAESNVEQNNEINEVIENREEVSNITNENSNLSEKEEMLNKARKFFADRGIKINSSGYSEMVGTNLYSGISELEEHRVFAFTIENYDIKDNNIWFYYSPETNAGYKYENDTWTKL